jgi:hypothetical protein
VTDGLFQLRRNIKTAFFFLSKHGLFSPIRIFAYQNAESTEHERNADAQQKKVNISKDNKRLLKRVGSN